MRRRWCSGITTLRWLVGSIGRSSLRCPMISHTRKGSSSGGSKSLASARVPWAVRNSGDDRLLGSVELRPRPDGGADASYATHPQYRGRGYAARALDLVCDWAFKVAG